MVLVGNKCDLQGWAVNMAQAREVSLQFVMLIDFRDAFMAYIELLYQNCRLPNSMVFLVLKPPPKLGWVWTMPFIRLYVKFAKTKNTEGKRIVSIVNCHIANLNVKFFKSKKKENPTAEEKGKISIYKKVIILM